MNEQVLNLLKQVFEVCIIPLLGVLTTWLITYIRAKKIESKERYNLDVISQTLDSLEKLVVDCVLATKQTYVDELKKTGKFDREAQLAAFEKTKNAVLDVLSDDTKALLDSAIGDLGIYITQLIEAAVNSTKN